MRDSQVGDQWIYEMCQLNPVKRVIDPATGQWNGNITTGPVRLAFTDSVFEAKPKMKTDPNSPLAFSVNMLFTPWTDITIFHEEYARICQSDFARFANGQGGYAVDYPLLEQGNKAGQYAGYTPGLKYINPSSKYKPSVVDFRGNPIVDQSKVYPGVWAIGAVSPYASGVTQVRKGPRFGLQSIMIIGDDKKLSGAAPDPRTLFQGTNVRPPAAATPAGFGQAPPQVPQPGIGAGALGGAAPAQAPFGAAPYAPPPPPPPPQAAYVDPQEAEMRRLGLIP